MSARRALPILALVATALVAGCIRNTFTVWDFKDRREFEIRTPTEAQCAIAGPDDLRLTMTAPGKVLVPIGASMLSVACERQGWRAPVMRLREVRDGWIIMAVDFWPGARLDHAVFKYQITALAIEVPMEQIR
ncbi:MAG: hypothetical protein FJX46_10680 [Alphaproteobacteria bacterium]|nr:hypothetical protein [Alphaproteobacteria bacterium]